MLVRKSTFDEVLRQRDEAARRLDLCREAFKRQQSQRVWAERRLSEALEKLANRPIQVVQPPDTADIIRQTVDGVATILNGWRDNPASQAATAQKPLSMDEQGLTADAGVGSVDDFVPPWEMMSRSNLPNIDQNSAYPPYVPGGGRIAPPPGGIE